MTEKLMYDDDSDVIDVKFDDVTELQKDLDGDLDAIFSEFGGGDDSDEYEIRVYRVQEGKGKLGYLFACLPQELPILDKLRDEYGGGNFEVRILKNKKIHRRLKTLIEEPVKKQIQNNGQNNSDLIALVNAMNNGFGKLGELIINQNSQNTQNAPDPMTMQNQILTNMISMKELFGSDKPVNQDSPIQMMTQLVEIQKSLNVGESGGATSADVLLSMANTVLPKLAEMGEQSTPARRSTKQLSRPGQSQTRSQPQAPTQSQPNKKINQDNPMKMHLIFLCAQAKLNNNPYTYATMVVDNTAPDKLDELKSFITGEDAIDKMALIHSNVSNYPAWFTELGECIEELLNPQPELTKPQTSTINVGSGYIPGLTGTTSIADIPQPEPQPEPKPGQSNINGDSAGG